MLLLLRNPQVLRLFLAQALFWSCSMTGIILTSIVGLQLAPLAGLATLPLALLMLGGLLALQPIARLMQRHGRRLGFLVGALAGVAGGLICALSLRLDSFALFCLGALPIGAYQASAMYYRFAAMEAVSDTHRGRATAYVIGGGVVAALITPSLSAAARELVALPFAGAYLLIAVLAASGFFVLIGLPSARAPVSAPAVVALPWRELLARPTVRAAVLTTAAGHGLMILVMNATPLAMHGEGFDLQASGQVIQWHMLGMFLPAFIAGPLVDRLGSRLVACLGGGLLIASAVVALLGVSHAHFLISSCLLGIGWNLMLVAGTTQLGQGHTSARRRKG